MNEKEAPAGAPPDQQAPGREAILNLVWISAKFFNLSV